MFALFAKLQTLKVGAVEKTLRSAPVSEQVMKPYFRSLTNFMMPVAIVCSVEKTTRKKPAGGLYRRGYGRPHAGRLQSRRGETAATAANAYHVDSKHAARDDHCTAAGFRADARIISFAALSIAARSADMARSSVPPRRDQCS